MKYTVKHTLFATLVSVTSLTAYAETYLGFGVGEAKKHQVQLQLQADNARFETDYGYKGYRDLAMFKVNDHATLNKYGEVESAWLYFTPEHQLYRLEVTYFDAGSTHTLFSDALNAKYKRVSHRSFGFTKEQVFSDNAVNITLKRNEFGFGRDQKTTLTYEYQPALAEVNKMKRVIEDRIKQQNAQKAGDL